MITAIVRFKIPQGMALADAEARFKESAPQFEGLAGLVRKYYLFDPAGTAGGVYLWESREAAERLYTEEWRNRVAEKYGAPPEISYYETPVIVDNSKRAATDAAA